MRKRCDLQIKAARFSTCVVHGLCVLRWPYRHARFGSKYVRDSALCAFVEWFMECVHICLPVRSEIVEKLDELAAKVCQDLVDMIMITTI